MRDRYGNDPSFLRVNGKFVVFVYADGNDACGMVDRWKQANTVGAYIVLKVFPGYRDCPASRIAGTSTARQWQRIIRKGIPMPFLRASGRRVILFYWRVI